MSLVRSSALLLGLVLLGCASDPPPPPPSATAQPAEIPPPPPLEPPPVTNEWVDTTEGVEATLVYVTEQGQRGNASAAAIVLSSDPKNPHFERRNTARVTVQKLKRAELAHVLQDLAAHGFDALPWKTQAYDAEIGPQRAFYLYRDGKRTWVEKSSLPEAVAQTFTALERRVIQASMHERPAMR